MSTSEPPLNVTESSGTSLYVGLFLFFDPTLRMLRACRSPRLELCEAWQVWIRLKRF